MLCSGQTYYMAVNILFCVRIRQTAVGLDSHMMSKISKNWFFFGKSLENK